MSNSTKPILNPEADKELVTVLIHNIALAMEKDYKQQAKSGFRTTNFSLSEFNRLVHNTYSLSNKQTLTYGKSIGKKILQGRKLNKTDSYIGSTDLENVCRFLLVDQGSLGWKNVRQAIEEMEGEGVENNFKDLLKLEPVDIDSQIESIAKEAMTALRSKPGRVAPILRDLANIIEPLEDQRAYLIAQNAQMASRNQELEQAIKRVQTALSRLQAGIHVEQDPERKAYLQKVLKSFKQKVFNIDSGR
ncbi:hypothetical protein [Lewinella sp. JB7]|uniref:hypothetical protein n=1 Tax=Lewinella sp. JB7 TaxID=2962887 RepID=UPI0020C98D4E|nr:hypothetical protein [Lewinella sp. JB7]MCP9237181.1 hypothetical protein [Lewinella sp. JB7]